MRDWSSNPAHVARASRDNDLDAAEAFIEALEEMTKRFEDLQEEEKEVVKRHNIEKAYDYAMGIL